MQRLNYKPIRRSFLSNTSTKLLKFARFVLGVRGSNLEVVIVNFGELGVENLRRDGEEL